ncbi:unnamed protein product [Spodoptera exigua]|nr:unnamed protein product [Spodoptera exigua]
MCLLPSSKSLSYYSIGAWRVHIQFKVESKSVAIIILRAEYVTIYNPISCRYLSVLSVLHVIVIRSKLQMRW